MSKAAYYVNGVPLDDPTGRWFVTSASGLPGVSGVETALVASAAGFGQSSVGRGRRAPGRLAVTVFVDGFGSVERLRENWATLMNVVSSWQGDGSVRVSFQAGDILVTTRGLLTGSVTPTMFEGATCCEAVFTFLLPDSVWEEEERTVLLAERGGSFEWEGLAGGSAPVFPSVELTGSATRVTVRCLNSGHTAVWSGRASGFVWRKWDVRMSENGAPVKELSAGVEECPMLVPNIEGEFKVQVAVEGGGTVRLLGRRMFQ